MATRDEPGGGLRSGYATKFGVATALLLVFLTGASYHAYTDLAAQMPPSHERMLLSGFLTLLLTFVAGVAVIGATIGREALSSLALVRERARQMERGDLDVDLQTGKTDEIGDLVRSFATMRDALQTRIRRAEEQNSRLRARVDDYSEAMRAAADGDLTVRMEPDEEIEAMAQVAESFNGMMEELEDTVIEVRSFATEVSEAADDLSEQAARSREAATTVATVAENIEQGEVEVDLRPGDEDVRLDAVEMEAVDLARVDDESTRETLRTLTQASARMEEVDDVADFISEVANETNMLALNASIEASKVEGGSEGFEVVADEIKSLAEETSASADEIETMMSRVREETTEAIDTVAEQQEDVMDSVADQTGSLRETSNRLRGRLTDLDVSEPVDAGTDAGARLDDRVAVTDGDPLEETDVDLQSEAHQNDD
jgi:methyl-accepting chemotaxis protein